MMNETHQKIIEVLESVGREDLKAELIALEKKKWQRTSLSEKSAYFIPKERYLELKHFCLQYPAWIRQKNKLNQISVESINYNIEGKPISGRYSMSSTEKIALELSSLDEKIQLIEGAAKLVCVDILNPSIFVKAITNDYSYEYVILHWDCPELVYITKRDWYQMYHHFFWILSKSRN